MQARGNGNITDDGLRTYLYDALNRLIQVCRKSDGLVIATYTYDALGRRTVKVVSQMGLTGTVPNYTWTYLYDGARVIEELIAETGTVLQYVWGQYIDELVQLTIPESITIGPQPLSAGGYYLLSDLLYRSVALTDNTGAIVEAYDTDAYGNTLLFIAGGGTGGTWFSNADTQADYSACRYVFTGREYDAETQIYFYRTRYYPPRFGRFLSRDLAGFSMGENLYSCVDANPLVYVDPTGMQSEQDEFLFTRHGREHQRLRPQDPIPAGPPSLPLASRPPLSLASPPPLSLIASNVYIALTGGEQCRVLDCVTRCVDDYDPLGSSAIGSIGSYTGKAGALVLGFAPKRALGIRTAAALGSWLRLLKTFAGLLAPVTFGVGAPVGRGLAVGAKKLTPKVGPAAMVYGDYIAWLELLCLNACVGDPSKYSGATPPPPFIDLIRDPDAQRSNEPWWHFSGTGYPLASD